MRKGLCETLGMGGKLCTNMEFLSFTCCLGEKVQTLKTLHVSEGGRMDDEEIQIQPNEEHIHTHTNNQSTYVNKQMTNSKN